MALYIVSHHYLKEQFIGNPIVALLSLGQEVVVVFLMMSGFLSQVSLLRNEKIGVRQYFNNKARRILPLYLISIFVSSIVALFVSRSFENSFLYALLGNLLILQDNGTKPGLWFNCVGGNSALWYMSYQWWDYVMFIALAKILHRFTARFLLVYTLCIASMVLYTFYPNHLSILIWYYWIFEMGCYMALIHFGRVRVSWYVPLSILLMILVWLLIFGIQRKISIGYHPNVEVRHFAFCLLIFIIYMLMRRFKFRYIPYLKVFGVFSSFSYGIYLLHVPMKILCTYIVPNIVLALSFAVILTFSIAFCLERQLIGHFK